MNLVIHVFDTTPEGPLWKRVDEVFYQHPKNFGLIGTWQGEQGAASLASTLGLSFPSIAFGVFCPTGIKYFAKLPGMSTVQQIYNSVDSAYSQPEPNCNAANQPLPNIPPNTGDPGTGNGGGGGGWGGAGGADDDGCFFADLPIIGDSLSFLCGVDKWLWLGLTAYSTLKTVDANKREAQVAWGALATYAGFKTAQKFKLLVPWWAYGAVAGYTAFKTKESLPKNNPSFSDANTVTYTYGLGTAYLLFRAYKSFEASHGKVAGIGSTRRRGRRMKLRLPPVNMN